MSTSATSNILVYIVFIIHRINIVSTLPTSNHFVYIVHIVDFAMLLILADSIDVIPSTWHWLGQKYIAIFTMSKMSTNGKWERWWCKLDKVSTSTLWCLHYLFNNGNWTWMEGVGLVVRKYLSCFSFSSGVSSHYV